MNAPLQLILPTTLLCAAALFGLSGCGGAELPEQEDTAEAILGSCGSAITAGGELHQGQWLYSCDGTAGMVVATSGGVTFWGTVDIDHMVTTRRVAGTYPNAYLKMQTDGNLALKSGSGAGNLWTSNTGGHPFAFARLGNDGVVRMYSSTGELFHTIRPTLE